MWAGKGDSPDMGLAAGNAPVVDAQGQSLTPALFGGIWDVHGQLFITLESMGVEQRVHDAVFNAIHNEKRKLATAEEMAEFLAAHGIDKSKFLSTFNSFAVKGQMAKAKKLAADAAANTSSPSTDKSH